MTPIFQKPSTQRAGRRWRVLCGWGCVLALLLQVILPTTAQASGGIWIEICGEFGAEMVLMDVSGDETEPAKTAPCPDCGPCMLCAATAPAVFPDFSVTRAPGDAVLARFRGHDADVPPNDAQFWPDNRGPPVRRANVTILDLPSMPLTRTSIRRAGS